MFSYLRSKMKIVFLIVAAAFLITIFAFWGMDIDTAQLRGSVAFTVNGEDISIQTFEETVSRYRDQYRGQDITPEFSRQIRKQAAEDLISEKLLEQKAADLGLYATKEELKGHVRIKFPSEDVYRAYLQKAPGGWWQRLEEETDHQIRVNRARGPIADGVWVSDSEWVKIINDLYWEADVSHILFVPTNEVTDSDVRAYYEEHRARILEPAKVRTRQILFKLAEDASETDVRDVTARAVKVLELAKAGKDFAALAKKYSDAPDAEDGGDMGYNKEGDMIPEAEAVAFKLSLGQISDTFVRSEFGLHILKLEDRVAASIRLLTKELIDELRASSVTDTHSELARERAQRVLDTLQDDPEQFEILARLHSQADSRKKAGRLGWMPRLVFPSGYDPGDLTGEVTRGQAIEMVIGRAIFETPVGSVAKELVRSSFGWHILKVHDRRQILDHPPTDTDASLVRNSYLRLLSEDNLGRWLREQRKKATVKFTIDIES